MSEKIINSGRVEVGDILYHQKYGNFLIEKYVNCSNVYIKFLETGWSYKSTSGNIRKGLIKDYAKPSVYGVGYNTLGKLPKKSGNPIIHEAYDKWVHMLRRCYCPKFLKSNKTYNECSVEKSWLDFKNFLGWYLSVRKDEADSSWNLDKDLVSDYEEKIYSSESCELVPPAINRLIVGCRTNKIVNSSVGIHVHEKTGRYRAYCNNLEGERVNLGTFGTEAEAFNTYSKFKDSVVRAAAKKYKNLISERLYLKLYNYETRRRCNEI